VRRESRADPDVRYTMLADVRLSLIPQTTVF
jgi:hypothetical protein